MRYRARSRDGHCTGVACNLINQTTDIIEILEQRHPDQRQLHQGAAVTDPLHPNLCVCNQLHRRRDRLDPPLLRLGHKAG
ncbi:MAG: hypothetical protein DWH81_07580, partial [Planctomycetota bacterium]